MPAPGKAKLAIFSIAAVAACLIFGPRPVPLKKSLRQARVLELYARLPLSFEVNQGQADGAVKFLSRGPGYTLFLTPAEAVLSFVPPQRPQSTQGTPPDSPSAPSASSAVSLRMKLVGANPHAKITPLDELPGKSNYFLGNDPTQWRTNVPHYARVRYESVYPGIDLVFYGNQGQLEFDFVVAPGANPRAIQLAFDDTEKLEITKRGDLLIRTATAHLFLGRPTVYQELNGLPCPIEGSFESLEKGRVRFRLGNYDPTKALIIDPVLASTTFLASASSFSPRMALDPSGNAYLVVTAYERSWRIFVAKVKPDGTVEYTTTVGGNSPAYGNGLAADALGNVYITGSTFEINGPPSFPITPGAFQTGWKGGHEAFVFKLNATGALAYSTFLGGSANDNGSGIAIDSMGNAYVTGSTISGDFPIEKPLQPGFGGGGSCFIGSNSFPCADAFVVKLNSTGSALLYSTYLGGRAHDYGNSIAVDPFGSAYVTGATTSTNFPTTSGAPQTSIRGSPDAFVTKLNPSGSAFVYSTYLGGNLTQEGYGIAADSLGNAYITGTTTSSNFPVTAGVFQPEYRGVVDAFLAKINAEGTGLIYSSFLGGSRRDGGAAIALDISGNVYVVGSTDSLDFPTVDPFQLRVLRGGNEFGADAFVTKVNAQGTALIFSTYLGGTGNSEGSGVGVDAAGDPYIAGIAGAANFPAPIAPSPTLASYFPQVFLAKLNPRLSIRLSSLTPTTVTVGEGGIVLTVNGEGFTPDCVVRWLGADQPTRFVSSSQLEATIPESEISRSGEVRVTVFKPGPDGGSSFWLRLVILPSRAVITSLDPSSAIAGGPRFTLTVTGSGFLPGAVVTWNGIPRDTTFVSRTTLQAQILGTDIALGGTARVAVRNPDGGGSTEVNFTIVGNTTPFIRSIAPTGVAAGSPDLILTVNGGNFVAESVVRWNAGTRVTTFVSSTQLRAAVLTSDVASPGTAQVTVFNPPPGGGISNPLTFTIFLPPTLTSLSPASAAAGGPGFSLTVNGAGFVPGSTVLWNGNFRPTTFRSSSEVIAAIEAADISIAGTAQVTVANPPPGGGPSSAMPFTILAGRPAVNPGGVVNAASFAGQPPSPGSISTLFGTNLAASAQQADRVPLPTTLGGVRVELNGIAAPLFFVSPTQINFQIPWQVAGQTQVSVVVTVDGVASNPQTLNLSGFSPGLFALTQTGTGQGAVLIAGTAAIAAPSGSFPEARPVRRGEFISIFCTGLGPVSNPPASGAPAPAQPLSATTTTPTVTIGGMPARVTFSGLAPGFVGLYQVNAEVPASAASGSGVQVALTIGGAVSNTVTIAVE